MSDLLSQNQIDDLMSAVRSGDIDVNMTGDDESGILYRKYDFGSPKKFTKDRIKMLNGVFENYSRIANSMCNARLHVNCQFFITSIEEQRYYDFSNSLTEGDVLALMDVKFGDGKKEDTPAMLYLSTPTALSLMDRMMGGDGAMDEDLPEDYSYTEMELRLYEEISKDMISVIGKSWENYLPIVFEYSKTDTNPTFSQILGLDEIVMIVEMKMQFDNAVGRMCVCLPSDTLSDIFTRISLENPGRKAASESRSEQIFTSLRDSEVEIVSILGRVQLSLSDIYNMKPGDVIDLGRSKDSAAYLDIGGYHWFTGRIGTNKKNMAVRIDEVFNQVEQKE